MREHLDLLIIIEDGGKKLDRVSPDDPFEGGIDLEHKLQLAELLELDSATLGNLTGVGLNGEPLVPKILAIHYEWMNSENNAA
jgi:hypothetical protein